MEARVGPLKVAEKRNDFVSFVWRDGETCYKPPYTALRAFSGNEEINKGAFNQDFFTALPLLPCRVPQSPLLAMLLYNKEKPWISRFTTVLQAVWDLYQLVGWFWVMEENYRIQSGNKRRAEMLRVILEKFKSDTRKKWEGDLEADLKTFHQKMLANGVTSMRHSDARACMIDFAQNVLWPYSIRLINDLERCVYACANTEVAMSRPVEELLTPADPVNEEQFPWPDKLVMEHAQRMQNWFQTKQSNVNAQDGIDDNYEPRKDGFVPRSHIDHRVISDIMKKSRNDAREVWQRCVPFYTLWQYCMFFDRHTRILGNASEGFIPK